MKWPEVRRILDHAPVADLITSQTIIEAFAADFPATALRRIYLIEPSLQPKPWRSWTELTENDGVFERIPKSPDQLSLVLHTSGSKGQPKGVMLAYRNLNHILHYRLAHTQLAPDCVSIVASCLTQSVGLYQSLALLAAGGTLVLLESYDVDEMAGCINRYQPTHLIMVVNAFDRLLHHPAITAGSLASLRFAAAGADRVTARVQDRFIALTGRPLRVSYGMTESSWALVNPGERLDKRLALGKPCPGVEIRLRGRDGGEVSNNEVGEIFIHSPRNMLGYLGDAELTRETLAESWIASGDLACRDDDGYYWFAGRKKNLIVLNTGDNVSPVEVENAILDHTGVSGCAVVGVSTPDGSEVPCAFVIRLDPALSAAALEAFLRERISDYKIPRRIEFRDELPVGLTGKIRGDDARGLARPLAESGL
jgi:long-chain acyl-CoA synthetase